MLGRIIGKRGRVGRENIRCVGKVTEGKERGNRQVLSSVRGKW